MRKGGAGRSGLVVGVGVEVVVVSLRARAGRLLRGFGGRDRRSGRGFWRDGYVVSLLSFSLDEVGYLAKLSSMVD